MRSIPEAAFPDSAVDLVRSILGAPWVNGARGPEEFDCWGVVHWCYKQILEIDLPWFPCDAHDLRAVTREFSNCSSSPQWELVDRPKRGMEIVLMSSGRLLHHVGLWLPFDGGRVLHSLQGVGVRLQSESSLTSFGIQNRFFYKYVPGRPDPQSD